MREVTLPGPQDRIGSRPVFAVPDGRPPVGVDEDGATAGSQNAMELGKSTSDIRDVLEDLEDNSRTARPAGEWQRGYLAASEHAPLPHPRGGDPDPGGPDHAGLPVEPL